MYVYIYIYKGCQDKAGIITDIGSCTPLPDKTPIELKASRFVLRNHLLATRSTTCSKTSGSCLMPCAVKQVRRQHYILRFLRRSSFTTSSNGLRVGFFLVWCVELDLFRDNRSWRTPLWEDCSTFTGFLVTPLK